MQVETTVDESDIGRISIGQDVTFSVDAYSDETFHGTISQIRLAPVTIQNVVNYTVVVDVNNDQLKLMPGMTANVKVLVANSHDVLRVSNMALRFQPPADLIDSSRIQELRDAKFSDSKVGADTSHAGWGGSGPAQGSDSRGKQFKAMRDSILAAHGGEMSPDELRNEMKTVFGKMQQTSAVSSPPQPAMRVPKNEKFGITLRYPEYEKSPYIPQHQAARARIWILNAKGKLEPVFVTTGITDGKYTEVTTSALKPGDQIVLGVSSNSDAATAQNPLTGGGGGGQRQMIIR
jgi:HlyD family secretion protein